MLELLLFFVGLIILDVVITVVVNAIYRLWHRILKKPIEPSYYSPKKPEKDRSWVEDFADGVAEDYIVDSHTQPDLYYGKDWDDIPKNELF